MEGMKKSPTADDIMASLAPQKSGPAYNKAWVDFSNFSRNLQLIKSLGLHGVDYQWSKTTGQPGTNTLTSLLPGCCFLGAKFLPALLFEVALWCSLYLNLLLLAATKVSDPPPESSSWSRSATWRGSPSTWGCPSG